MWRRLFTMRRITRVHESPRFCLTPISNEHFPNTAAIFMWTDGQNSDSLAGQTLVVESKAGSIHSTGAFEKSVQKKSRRGVFCISVRVVQNFCVFVCVYQECRRNRKFCLEQEFMATVASLGKKHKAQQLGR